MGYTFMYFLYNAFLQTCLRFAKKKKRLKNCNNWVNTKFVTKVFCKISRLSDLNYCRFYFIFFFFKYFLPGEREGYQMVVGKKKKKRHK